MPEGDAGLEGLEITGMAAIVLLIVDARLDCPVGPEIMSVSLDPQGDSGGRRPSHRDQRSPVEHGFRGIHEVEVRGVADLRAVFVCGRAFKIESPDCFCHSSLLCSNGTSPFTLAGRVPSAVLPSPTAAGKRKGPPAT